MRKRNIIPAVLGALAFALTGCGQADEARAEGTAPVYFPVGSTAGSIAEVREALDNDDVRNTVKDNLSLLLSRSEGFDTPFEFERDLFVCELVHPIPADHAPDHPESQPLADCVLQTFEAHQVGRS
ncbi:hypothetical protein NMP99_02940 [Glutamicibacter mishrai]|uniref:hypothetical protein n=1 Tax=Glutamicibacter mishrai TaxID=1775880 RepID=UPI0020CD2A00|nr:hypothetical protein [Glutamicibacter mishrai]UTT40231.1 hypothetical protein NMP99_02650 [Glutamicibacter mishrai]UTT40282.1 hypothetical protein NMP99_02940 [Glutamicibacter mishrai]